MKTDVIYIDDCLNALLNIPKESIDLFVTDPPYKLISGGVTGKLSKKITGVTLNHNNIDTKNGNGNFKHNDIKFSQWLPLVYRTLKDKAHAYIMVNDRNLQEMLNEGQKAGFKLLNVLVWNKNNAMPNHWYMKNAEFIVMFRKGGARYINNQGSKQVMQFDNVKDKIHPTQKPVELIATFILNSSNENDVVLDCFSGAGTTCQVASILNRKYIGIEIDSKYANLLMK